VLPYQDLAEVLQARIVADLKATNVGHASRNRAHPDERRTVGVLEARIAMLEENLAKAEALGEQRRHEAETAAKRVAALQADIARLEEALAKAETVGEQRRHEAETATKQADGLLAELVEMTKEFVAMTKQIAEQKRCPRCANVVTSAVDIMH